MMLIGIASSIVLIRPLAAKDFMKTGCFSFTAIFGAMPPPHDANTEVSHAKGAAVAAPTLPMWSYSITSPLDGNTYNGTMVGGDPFFNGARTTNIPTYIGP